MTILLILLIILLGSFAWAGLSTAPWVPCKSTDLDQLIKLAHLKTTEVFVDLGAGNGKTVIAAARAGATAHGYEISLIPYIIARIKIIFLPKNIRDRVFFHYKSLWNAELKNFDCIYLFLMPKILPRLVKKIQTECKPGTKIICYVWPLPKLFEKNTFQEKNRPKIYFYEV